MKLEFWARIQGRLATGSLWRRGGLIKRRKEIEAGDYARIWRRESLKSPVRKMERIK